MKNIALFLIGVVFFVLVISIVYATPPPRFVFKMQNGTEIPAIIDYKERPNGRFNVDIRFDDDRYVYDKIKIKEYLPPSGQAVEISLGDFRIESPDPEIYTRDFSTHLIGSTTELDFEEMIIKLKVKGDNEIRQLLECENWDTENFVCLSEWINSTIGYLQDNVSMTFTTTHLSGWTGTSFMYDDFELTTVSDYCVTSNATASGWTGKICHAGSGTFQLLNSSDAFMGNRVGNLTADGGGARTEVYKYWGVETETIDMRVYFKTDCNNPVAVPAGAGKLWIILQNSDDAAGTNRLMIGFNQDEELTCGGFLPNLFECSGVTHQTIACDEWHYVDLYADPIVENLTCFLDGVSFCSEQGVNAIPSLYYGSLGKSKDTDPAVTGTIHFDELRASDKYIGGYPNISNFIEKKDPINDNEGQQLNATIIDLDGDLSTVWIVTRKCAPFCGAPTTRYVTNVVGNEYYFDFDSGNFTHGAHFNYTWYANDSNNQIYVSDEYEFRVDNCVIPSINLDWNITTNCTVSSNFDLGTGDLIFSGGNLTYTNNAQGIIKSLIVELRGFFMNVSNKGVFLNITG